jgi:hypothetical protein
MEQLEKKNQTQNEKVNSKESEQEKKTCCDSTCCGSSERK